MLRIECIGAKKLQALRASDHIGCAHLCSHIARQVVHGHLTQRVQRMVALQLYAQPQHPAVHPRLAGLGGLLARRHGGGHANEHQQQRRAGPNHPGGPAGGIAPLVPALVGALLQVGGEAFADLSQFLHGRLPVA